MTLVSSERRVIVGGSVKKIGRISELAGGSACPTPMWGRRFRLPTEFSSCLSRFLCEALLDFQHVVGAER